MRYQGCFLGFKWLPEGFHEVGENSKGVLGAFQNVLKFYEISGSFRGVPRGSTGIHGLSREFQRHHRGFVEFCGVSGADR